VQAVKRTLQFFDQIKPTLLKSKVVTTNASEAKQ
jgi:hypothetical protein